jgi:hypothetical protein
MTVVALTALVPHQPVPHRTRLAQAGSCETWEHHQAEVAISQNRFQERLLTTRLPWLLQVH